MKEKGKYTEKSMLKAVHNYFASAYNYGLKNSFVFRYDWESDYFCVNREGYSFEIEVKISKSDFKNDIKKEKHKLFVDKATDRLLPNRFYYAVPKGLINESDVPAYAGLMIVEGSHATIVKRAPFIHKKKHDFRKTLCDKFYFNWLNQKKKINLLEYDLEVANNKIAKLWINGFIAENFTWEILRVDFEKRTVLGRKQSYWDMKTHVHIKPNEIKEFKIDEVKFK